MQIIYLKEARDFVLLTSEVPGNAETQKGLK